MVIVRMRLKGSIVCVHLSSGKSFVLPKKGVVGLDLCEGLEVDEDDIITLKRRANEEAACKAAMEMLTRSLLSEQMLVRKLTRKDYKKRYIRFAVKYCKEYDLINDRRFTKITLQSLRLKGKSRRFILSYLRQMGLSARLIERASHALSSKGDLQMLKNAILKYYPLYEGRARCEELLTRALIRKGFDYQSVNKTVKKYIKKMNIQARRRL